MYKERGITIKTGVIREYKDLLVIFKRSLEQLRYLSIYLFILLFVVVVTYSSSLLELLNDNYDNLRYFIYPKNIDILGYIKIVKIS